MPQPDKHRETTQQELEHQLMVDLEAQHGPLLNGRVLYRALGLPSADAFRQAACRGQLQVRVFTLPNRRGRFALTRDVAHWLAGLHNSGLRPGEQP